MMRRSVSTFTENEPDPEEAAKKYVKGQKRELLPRPDMTGPAPDQSRKLQMQAIYERINRNGSRTKDPSAHRPDVIE